MAGGLRRRFKPYGLESGPSWPLSSMPFSVTKTSEELIAARCQDCRMRTCRVWRQISQKGCLWHPLGDGVRVLRV